MWVGVGRVGQGKERGKWVGQGKDKRGGEEGAPAAFHEERKSNHLKFHQRVVKIHGILINIFLVTQFRQRRVSAQQLNYLSIFTQPLSSVRPQH